MCGIVGYTGRRQAAPVLLDGLSKLEYRGYDSAGLAVRDGARLAEVVKATGKLRNLAEKVIFNRTPEYMPILEAARIAPSSFNRQPWAFVSDDRQRLHLFRRRSLVANPVTEFHQCVDCGAALAHLVVAAKAKGYEPEFKRLKPEPSFKRGLVYQCSLQL